MLFINAIRLAEAIDQLARITSEEPPVVTRVVYSESDRLAREFIRNEALALGLEWETDAVGNQFATWKGSRPDLIPAATGSHIDAIPNAGRFDGTVGVLGALEAIRCLQASDFHPVRSIQVIVFTSEEPTRFGIGCLGSRMLSGLLTPSQAAALRDPQGTTLDELRTAAGFTGELAEVAQPGTRWSAFVELHIEQGPILEETEADIGIVERIAGPSAYRLKLTGTGGHAGAVLMPERHDALLAGAEIALAAEHLALNSGSPDTVATTGVFEVRPGAINSIPCDVRMELDLRDTDLKAREEVFAQLQETSRVVCQKRGVAFEWQKLNADPPVVCDERLVTLASNLSQELGFVTQRMISRAYHDSLFMAQLCPTTMIFIPCFKGYSHRPDEYASAEQMRKGVLVLAKVLQHLSVA